MEDTDGERKADCGVEGTAEETDTFDVSALSRSLSRSIPEGAVGDIFAAAGADGHGHADGTDDLFSAPLTRSLAFSTAPVPFTPAGPERSTATAAAPMYRSTMFFQTAAPSSMLASTTSTASKLHSATAPTATQLPEPPVLPPQPFFLVDTHCDVTSCTSKQVMDALHAALLLNEVSVERCGLKHKFKCHFYSCDGRFSNFRVKVYRRSAEEAQPVYIIESQHRRGDSAVHSNLYAKMLPHLNKVLTMVPPAVGANSTTRCQAPIACASNAHCPLPVPASLFASASSTPATAESTSPSTAEKADIKMTPVDIKPLTDMLTAKYDDVCHNASRALASLCASESAAAAGLLSSEDVAAGLVEVLKHPDRSMEAQVPAAAALVHITGDKDGQKAVLAAGGLQPLLMLAGEFPKTPAAAAAAWHLRRSCLRSIANLCCSECPIVGSSVQSSADCTCDILRDIVTRETLTESSGLREEAQRALAGLSA